MLKQSTILLFACAVLFVGTQLGSPASAQNGLVTGCLSNSGKISKLQVGDTPTTECKPNETQISLSVGGTPTLAVFASNGAQVGTLLTEDSIISLARVILGVPDSLGQERLVFLFLTAPVPAIDEASPNFDLIFETSNCTFDAWASHTFFGTTYIESATIVRDGAERRLYFANGPGETIQQKNELDVFTNTCSETNPPDGIEVTNAVPVELLHPDLHEEFPPPYTLELK